MARPKRPEGETASATTSPNNSSSALPYLIVVASLACVIALSINLANAIDSFLFRALSESDVPSYSDGFDGFDFFDNDDSENLDDLYDFYNFDGTSSSSPELENDSNTSQEELDDDTVLDYEVYSFDYSVADDISATDYAGSQSAVSSYVRTYSSKDKDAISQLNAHLRSAKNLEGAERDRELTSAAQVCKDASQVLSEITIPDSSAITGSKAQEIVSKLENARSEGMQRWTTISQIVDIMRSPTGHTTQELNNLDLEALKNLYNASSDLYDALSASAK